MSGFRKAKAEQAALKIAIYGAPGSGKTFTSLLLAEGLAKRDGKRVAYIDTEHGTDFYCQAVPSRSVHPEAFDFDAIYTRSIMEVLTVVRELERTGWKHHSVVVIDSITHMWEAARAAYEGKQTRANTIPMHAWGSIKKPYKEILSTLLSSPLHVFICGRQGTEYAIDADTEELRAIGYKMKAEGETPYEPHILLRMEAIKPKKTHELATIVAYAEKDRTGVLSGRSFVNPTFDSICAPLLGLLGRSQAIMKGPDEVAAEDAEEMERAEQLREKQSAELLRRFSARIDMCEHEGDLKLLGSEITPSLKAMMLPADLTALRGKYHQRTWELPGKDPKDASKPSAPKNGGVIPWKKDKTGEVAAKQLSDMLDERAKEMGITDLTPGPDVA
jgi:hypothetical protein